MPNAPKSTLANERFIALLIIIESKKPEVPSSAPQMMSTLLLEREAGRRRGETGVRVEQRDDDRHVGAADGQHREDAEHEARAAHRVEELDTCSGIDHEERPASPASRQNIPMFEDVLALVGDRRAGDEALQLAERHDASGERQRAEEHLEPERRCASRPRDVPPCGVELGDADQRRREAAERVRERDSLGHLGHRDPDRDRGADDRADDEPGDDPLVADDLVVEERRDDGDEHADLAEDDAAARVLGRAQPLQARMKQTDAMR